MPHMGYSCEETVQRYLELLDFVAVQIGKCPRVYRHALFRVRFMVTGTVNATI